MIGQHPVDLFRHPAVEAPQARFDVPHPHVEFRCRESPGHDGIRVPLHQNDVGRLFQEDVFDSGHNLRRLAGMGPGTHVEAVVRIREFKLLEEEPVHLIGVVLPRMKDKVVNPSAFALPDDGRHLDDLRSCAEYHSDHSTPSSASYCSFLLTPVSLQ
jgi:hypothetical protein